MSQRAPKLRIMQIATRLNVGGASLQIAALAMQLDPERFETRLIVGTPAGEEGNMLDLRPDLRSGLGSRLTVIPSLKRDLQPVADYRALRAIAREIRRFRPHVVHTHMAKAGTLGRLAAKRAHVPVRVHTFHGTVFQGHFNPVMGWAATLWERRLVPITEAFVAVSPSVAHHLHERGLASEQIRVIPLGLDLKRFAKVPNLLTEAPKIVTLIARAVHVKDVPLFLDAVSIVRTRIPKVQARVVGDGPLRAKLEAASPRWVTWLGDEADLAPVYASTRAVALSSRSEGSPVALIEALAAARPVAAVPVGGVPELLADRPGAVLSADRSPEALSEAIEKALTDPAIARGAALGREAIQREFATERMISETSSLYQDLVAKYASSVSPQ